MDQNCIFTKSMDEVQSNVVFTSLLNVVFTSLLNVAGELKDRRGCSVSSIGVMVPKDASGVQGGAVEVLLSKAAGQGILELVGTKYMVKGHAKRSISNKSKSKGRKKSAGKKNTKKGGKKAAKGRKKSVGPKKK